MAQLRAIDVFSGCGGLTMGLKQAGFDVIAALEIDKNAVEVYAENHRSTKVINADVRFTTGKEVLDLNNLRRGELDLLAGCPPCQGFSRIRHRNKGLAVDARNALIDDFARLVEDIFPKSVMMENVEAITTYGKFSEFLLLLKRNEFRVKYQVLDAALFNVAQRRRRLILIASRICQPDLARPSRKKITVKDAIGGLRAPGLSRDALHNLPEQRSPRVKKMIELVPANGGSRKDLPNELALRCHQRSNGFSDVYGRMAWDRQAPTITSGCSNPSKGRFLHPDQHRCITLREAALLQGFPRHYQFDVKAGKEALALMIGNALPPPFVKAHAKALKRSMLEVGND